jgi:hypothetical protein
MAVYHKIKTRLKISHHKHSGRYRPHEYTSYLPLFVLLVVAGTALMVSTVYAVHPPPQAGSVGLNGIMPGPAPTIAAVITSPSNGQHFSVSPITVTGTCPKTTLIEIYKSDIFAGSTPCDDNGAFSLSVDLLVGQNALIARVYNALNEPGPDSATVTVFYDALPPQASPITPLSLGGPQLLLTTDAVYRGTFPGQEMTIPIGIIGGIAPYAINVQWGDGSNDIIPRNNNITFRTGHTYKKPGTYEIILQGSDSQGKKAYLQVVTVVNGQPAVSGATTPEKGSVNKLIVLWPLWIVIVVAVICFWLGERREKQVLKGRGLLLQPQA